MPTETPVRELSDEEKVAVQTLKDVAQDFTAPHTDRVEAAKALLRYENHTV